MIHSIDKAGRIRAVSDRWLKKLGYERHEVIGVRSVDFLAPACRLNAEATHLPAFVQTGQCDNIELQMVSKTGVVIDVLVSGIPYGLGENRISLAVVTDITAQKMAERRLTESEARYRSIVDDQSQLVALTATDFTHLFVNKAFAKHHGCEPHAMMGRSLFDFVPTHAHAEVREHLRRTMASAEALPFENEILLADGRVRWVAWTNRAVRDADGNVTAVHSVGHDIDERKRAEMKLAESEARYRMLADHSTDMVFQFDQDLIRRYVSPACREILGFSPEELIGHRALLAVHPDEADMIASGFQEVASGRLERASFSHRIRHRDGHWLWVEAAVRSTRDPHTNMPNGLMGALRNITAKKEIEEKLAEANGRLEILARQDGLTQIYNRRSFDEMLLREIKIARREGTTLSLLMIDVDSFKAYNDHYGHPAGDAALRRVSSAISATVKRPGDFVARYGGEEFAVLLPNTDERGARAVAEAIRSSIEALALEHRASLWERLTVSIGAASINNAPHNELRQDVLLSRADNALYAAKNSGRNTIVNWREDPTLLQ